jgi:hypothetical protein
MDDIRRLHLSRFEFINPISDMIDLMAGKQWYSTPNFWNGGVSEAYPIHCKSMRVLFQYIIYGELFDSSLYSWLNAELSLSRFDLDTRIDYIRYCIPDWTCGRERAPVLGHVQRDRPYATEEFEGRQSGDGLALWYIISCGRWNRPRKAIREQIGPEFEDISYDRWNREPDPSRFAEEWRQEI